MQIRSHTPWLFVGCTVASLVTLGLPATFIYLMRQEGRDTWLVYAVTSPFLLVGLVLAFVGVRGLARLVLLGSWRLELPDQGGVLGQPLAVTLRPSRARTPTGELTCRLRCVRMERMSQTSGGGHNHVTTLWETTWTVRTGTIQPRLGVALTLPLPETGEPSHLDRTGSGIVWQLNVVVPAGAIEEPVFDLPVCA